MEQFITNLSPDYQLDDFRVKDNVVVFEISSKLKEVNCPYCGQPSSKVHSYYQREVQDLPMQNKKVVLLIKTRKMFCMNNACTKKTFSETHTFVDAKGKKTNRLERNIIYTSTQLSSVNASKVLKSSGINISKSSICALLKKMPSIVDKLSVKKICVDDFAIRKRFSYGTVMVDLETHRIIDLIPSRDVADVKEWLSKFPNVEVVSRDGAQIYASAANGAHPGVVQVSDRFHLIKGLSEAIDKYIIRTYPARLEIPVVSETTEEMKLLLNINNRSKRIRFAHDKKQQGMTVNEIALILHASPKTIEKYLNIDPNSVEDRVIVRESRHRRALEQKQHDVNEARRLYSEGMAIEIIAKELHHTYKTIQNYLNPEYSIVDGHYNVRIPNKLAPYEEEVKTLRSQGMTYPRIHKIISEKGYNGTEASLRMFMQKERIRQSERAAESDVNSDYQPKEHVQRKALSQLIYKSLEDVYIINKEQFQMVLKTYPLLADLYAMIKEFYEIVYSKKAEKLDDWISRLEKFDIPEIQTYINGVRKDINAVKNGISLAYNNGLAEGSVNKIKVIKRIMYGRNSFDLLKAKVLFHEEFNCKIN